MTTILLHGFWGQPLDWNPVLTRLTLGASVVTPDLYEPGLLAPRALSEWTQNFWRWVDEQLGQEPVQIVGYSMGGRLALNAAVAAPSRVLRLLSCSANPWLPVESHAERANWEQNWSDKFLRGDWAALESAWQDQKVFAGSLLVPRRRGAALRELLGRSLHLWSPRLHLPSLAHLEELPKTWDWAFGALDQNYLAMAKTLQAIPVRGQITVVPEVGHRLIAEAPDFVSQWIEKASDS